MRFDSHVVDLLEVAVALVNSQTGPMAGGRPFCAPSREDLRRQLADVLARDGRRPPVEASDAEVLARFAVDARAVFEAVADEEDDEAARRINALLAWTTPRPRLDRHDDGWNMHFHGPTERLGDGWAAGCAAALTMAVGSANRGRLGICEAPRCDRVYVDRSKNGTRRFCGLNCQNRVKNATHRRAGTTPA
jgi:hypothetical protein